MVIYCGVPNCKTFGNNGFHTFPANLERRKEWMRLTNISDLGLSESVKVCRKHFKDCELLTDLDGKKRLVATAVPSLFLPGQETLNVVHNYCSRDDIIPSNRRFKRAKASNKRTNELFSSDQIVVGNETEIGDTDTLQNLGPYIDIDYVKSLEEKLQQIKKEKTAILTKNRNLKCQVKRLKQKAKSSKLDDNKVLEYLRTKKKYSIEQIEFQKMQLRNSGRKKNGRRYKSKEKSFSLALYKSGPRSYRFKEKYMILPALSTLGRHSANLMFNAGRNKELLRFIKEEVKDWPDEDKICTLAFDETALKARLAPNTTMDEIDGFVELAGIRRPVFATHALTFMVRGMNVPFKQPVDFYYTHGLKSYELAELLILVLVAVLSTGLNVIATVSDQVITNESTIHFLMQRDFVRSPGCLLKYKVLDKTIWHCYDAPHLLKVERNNLQVKDLLHCVQKRWDISDSKTSGKSQVASWTDVENLYKLDRCGVHRFLPKITDEHIKPSKLKMKVCVATQVFSRTYGSVMQHCVEKKQLPSEASGTAQILIFFNDLFDSLNGSGEAQPDSLKGSINQHSVHFVFWEHALSMLSKMAFVDRQTGEINTRSNVHYRIMSTVRGYQEVTRYCLNSKMKEVALRNSNSDGLENFFGCVKTCCQIACTPTIRQFRTGYATMMLNNLTGPRPISPNCEKDSSKALLNNIHDLIEQYNSNVNVGSNQFQQNEIYDDVICDPQFKSSELNFLENGSLSGASNLICAKILKQMYCKKCISNIQNSEVATSDFIQENDGKFGYPSENFTKSFKRVFEVVMQIVPTFCSEKHLKKILIQEVKKILQEQDNEIEEGEGNLIEIGCAEHKKEITDKLYEFTITYSINIFCKNINDILTGKIKVLPAEPNDMQELAKSFWMKKSRIGKYTDIFKT